MSLQNKNPITYALKSIRENTTAAHKKKLAVLLLLILVSAILDVVGLAAVLPLLKAATDTAAIQSNEYLFAIYNFLGCADNSTFLLYLIGGLLAYFIMKTVFGVFVNWFQAKVTSQLAVYVANRQFDKYFSLMYIDFSKIKSSLLIRNMLYNPSSYVQWIIHPILMLFSEFTILLLIVGGIAAYDFFLFTFILLTLGPATILVYRALRKKGARIGTGIDQVFPYTLSSITEAISGYVDIKLAGQEGFYRNKYLKHLKNYMELQQSLYLHSQIPLRLNELIALTGIIVILLYALFIETGSKDVMIMVGVFAAAAYRLMPSINRILSSMMYLNNNKVSIENLYMFDERQPEASEAAQSLETLGFSEAIRFENVTFTFPDSKSPVISDVTLEVKKGERVGFVGVSGSGKTTLMNLMLRLYTEDEGKITVDNRALSEKNMKSWRRLIGYVKQDIFILDGTIRENIILADPNPDEERLKLAIRQASLESFVNALPEGMNTMVGERGGNLSGGQKQRIGIARSLYRNAEVLVFDEATSALDNQTENEVTEAIDALSQTHKTIFIIAHRLTTLKSCDRIYELRNGKIAGVHTYKELIEKMM